MASLICDTVNSGMRLGLPLSRLRKDSGEGFFCIWYTMEEEDEITDYQTRGSGLQY